MGDEWIPANEVEAAMARALGAGDRPSYFRELARAALLLPQVGGSPADGQRFVTADLFGWTYLLTFTSVPALLAATVDESDGHVADAYVVTNCTELRAKWPAHDWRLAVNPGTPIDAYLDIEAVEAAASGAAVVQTVGEALRHRAASEPYGPPGVLGGPDDPDSDRDSIVDADATDAALAAAGRAGDADAFVRALLDATVFVPTAVRVDAAEILEDDFPWLATGTAQEPTVGVFTSIEALERAYGRAGGDLFPSAPPYVAVAFAFLAALWPERFTLVVNPGSVESVSLPGDQVGLIPLWTFES